MLRKTVGKQQDRIIIPNDFYVESRTSSPDYWSSMVFFPLNFPSCFLILFILFSLLYPKKSLLRLTSRSGRLRTCPFFSAIHNQSPGQCEDSKSEPNIIMGHLRKWDCDNMARAANLLPCLQPGGLVPGTSFSDHSWFSDLAHVLTQFYLSWAKHGTENQTPELLMKESVQWAPSHAWPRCQ